MTDTNNHVAEQAAIFALARIAELAEQIAKDAREYWRPNNSFSARRSSAMLAVDLTKKIETIAQGILAL
jgi:hypothetical protein